MSCFTNTTTSHRQITSKEIRVKLQVEPLDHFRNFLDVFQMASDFCSHVHILNSVDTWDWIKTRNVAQGQGSGAMQVLQHPVILAVALNETPGHQHPHFTPCLNWSDRDWHPKDYYI